LVQHYLNGVAQTFDAAAAMGRKEFPFSCDITPDARAVAIGGSQQLIDAGHHREAVFWIVATHARCTQILAAAGAPSVGPNLAVSAADLLRMGQVPFPRDRALSFIPTLRGIVRDIVAAKEI
jgi:hypothetical protein